MTSEIWFNNVCSLQHKLQLLSPFLCASNPPVDVFAACETHPQDFSPPVPFHPNPHSKLMVPGYNLVVVDQPSVGVVQGLGGIAFYVREGIAHELLTDPAVFPMCVNTVTQVAWLLVRLPRPYIIGCCYLHPDATSDDLSSISSACAAVKTKYPSTPILLLGDFNGQDRRWGSERRVGHGKFICDKLLDQHQFTCLNEVWPGAKGVTTRRIPTQVWSILDLALCSDASTIEDVQIGDGDLSSDHMPLRITVAGGHHAAPLPTNVNYQQRWNIPKARDRTKTEKQRINGIHQRFGEMLDSHIVDSGIIGMNMPTRDLIEVALAVFTQCAKSSASVVFGDRQPQFGCTQAGCNRSGHPFGCGQVDHKRWWMFDQRVIDARSAHLQALTQWRARRSSPAAKELRNETRRVLRQVVRDVQREGWETFVAGLQDEHGTINWRVWYQSTHAMQRSALNNVKGADGSLPRSPIDALNNLANYYASVCDDSHSVGDPVTDAKVNALLSPANPLHPASIPHAVGDAPWTLEEVRTACKHIPLNTALGPDGMHPLFLRHAGPVATELLCRIFNAIHTIGYVPQSWRDADIVSLFKKGARSDPSNYRPISLTSVMARMYERMIEPRLRAIIEARLSRFQFGFRPGRSTLDAIAMLQQRIALAMRSKTLKHRRLPVAFLDIRKAFDTVHHRSLLYKAFTHFGVCGKLWSFLDAFLSNRRARTIDNEYHSDWKPMRSGVPQGSVTGPLLFLCYLNDLLLEIEELTECDPIAFADDLALAPRLNRIAGCNRGPRPGKALRRALRLAGAWAVRWRMTFSVGLEKSAVVMFRHPNGKYPFSPTHRPFRIPLRAGAPPLQLPYAKQYKHLGLILHEYGSWQPQFQHICSKLRRASFLVTRLLKDMHPRIGILMVKAVILPIYTYALAFWQPSPYHLYRFDSCMATPLRRVFGLPTGAHTVGTLAMCGIPCARATYEHMQMRTAARALFQVSPANPVRPMMQAAITRRYAARTDRRSPLAKRVQLLLRSGDWGDTQLGMNQFQQLTPKQVKERMSSLCNRRAFNLWNGGVGIDPYADHHHPSAAPLKQWYSGNSRKQILCEPSVRTDPTKVACLRARLRMGRASFRERCHEYGPTSRLFAPSPNCPECEPDVVIHSPAHVLLECPQFAFQRYRLDCDLESSIKRVTPPIDLPLLVGRVPSFLRSTSKRACAWLKLTGEFLVMVRKLVVF
jgi:hypothetical protein